jgi:hypothetical protein
MTWLSSRHLQIKRFFGIDGKRCVAERVDFSMVVVEVRERVRDTNGFVSEYGDKPAL